MAIRDKILRFYKGTEGEEAAVRLVDCAEQVYKTQKYRISDFLTPYEQEIAETVAANYQGVKVEFHGGYSGAERQQAVFIYEDFPGKVQYDTAAVEVSWREEFSQFSHRDVLGAVLGTGIERQKIGDILMAGGMARIVTTQKMAEFLLQQLVSVGSAGVKTAMGNLADIKPRELRCKEITATVASLRADSIAAAGFGMSRSRAASDIEAEKLQLNWQTVKNPAQNIKEGDVLSMRGRGRCELAEVRGKTKKGRIGVLLRRYI